MANLLSTIVTGGSGTTPTLSLDRNIATPSNYYNGVQLEIKATSGTAGIGLHRSGFSHVGIYHNAVNELRFDMNSGTVILNHNTGTIWGNGNLTNLNQLTNGPGYITSSASITGNASKLDPLSGDGNYKLAYTADGARNNAGEWGRAVMYYVPNGQTYGIRVDRADYSDSAGTAGYADEAKWISYPDGPRNLSDRSPSWNNRSVAWDFVGAGTANGSGNYGGVMTFVPWDGTSASTGDSSYQLAFANTTGVNASGQPKLSIRNGINSTWNDWYTLIHSGNIGSQSVSYATTAGTANIANFFGGYTAYGLVEEARGVHSFSDFVNGTLVTTDINASEFAGDSFVMEVSGKSYGSGTPFKLAMEGYLYANTVINVAAMSYGSYFPSPVKVMNLDGNLAFWWPRGSYWNSFEVHVRAAGGESWNRVTGISDSVDPASATKKVSVTPVQVIHTNNIGSQSVNYAASAGTSTTSTHLSGRTDSEWYNVIWGAGSPSYMYSSDSVRIRSSDGALRANIYYDNNDTTYYLDPNGTSNLNSVNAINFRPSNAIYFGGGNNYFNWTNSRIYSNVGIQSASDMLAPIFYDSQDTTYYGDFASLSRVNEIGANKMRADTNGDYATDKGWWSHDPYGQGWGKPHGSFRSLEVSTSGNFDTEPAMFRIHQWGSGAAEFWKPKGTTLYLRETPGGSSSWFTRFEVQGSTYVTSSMQAYSYQGHSNVAGTGNASYHPSGIYSTGTNWLYGTMYMNDNSIRDVKEVYNNGWFRTVGHQGIYNPTNDAHFYPNNASYGSWRIDGTRNGWHGLHFNSGSTLMMNSAETGVHREGYGWQFRWYNGSMFVSRGTYGGGTEYTVIDSGTIGSQSVNYATSAGNSSTTSQIVFNDLKTNFPSGAGGGHSFAANHYSMGLDSGNGGWDHPHYRDVIIGYHTGVRIGAHYSGIRFYNNSPTTDANNDGNGDGGEALLMTIGGYVGTANHTDVVVNNNLFANVSMRAPIFYDSNDTNYYGNFAGFSRMSEIGVTNDYVYNYFNLESSRNSAEFGNVGMFRARRSASGDYPSFSFQNQFGNHSWGQIARFHIEGAAGSDRPSIQFSSAYNNTRWNIGYCTGSDDHFRINQNMGQRPDGSGTSDGWGTERFRINTDGTAYLPSTLSTNEISHTNGRVSLTGNLHIDSYNGNDIYMNYYSSRGTRIYVGSGTLALHVNTDGLVYMPTVVVNSHSDNTKGYRINNTSGTAVSAMFTNSANALVLAAGALDQVQMNKKVFISGAALGVNIAASATAGRIDASNDIVAYSTSDERFKENITPISNALDKVKTLTGVEFDWRMETKDYHGYVGHDVGVIAQQVKAVLPEAVRTNANGYLAVRYEKLIGLLIEGMKEQQEQIEELKAKLDGIAR